MISVLAIHFKVVAIFFDLGFVILQSEDQKKKVITSFLSHFLLAATSLPF